MVLIIVRCPCIIAVTDRNVRERPWRQFSLLGEHEQDCETASPGRKRLHARFSIWRSDEASFPCRYTASTKASSKNVNCWVQNKSQEHTQKNKTMFRDFRTLYLEFLVGLFEKSKTLTVVSFFQNGS